MPVPTTAWSPATACGRKDSKLTINNAVKGMGFLPTKEKLPEMLRLLKTTWNDPMSRKLDILDSLYTSCQDNYDKTMLVSLELYSKPSFETHSFLNEMTDPGVSIVFLDMPSFEVRAIAQLLHPKDPQLSDYEKQVVDWMQHDPRLLPRRDALAVNRGRLPRHRGLRQFPGHG